MDRARRRLESLVIAAVKNGGIRVYDLDGQAAVQIVPPAPGGGRINNVDVVYGLELKDGRKVDSRRQRSRSQTSSGIFRIDARRAAGRITAIGAARAFRKRKEGTASWRTLDDQNTVMA